MEVVHWNSIGSAGVRAGPHNSLHYLGRLNVSETDLLIGHVTTHRLNTDHVMNARRAHKELIKLIDIGREFHRRSQSTAKSKASQSPPLLGNAHTFSDLSTKVGTHSVSYSHLEAIAEEPIPLTVLYVSGSLENPLGLIMRRLQAM
ncbi:hypothetical protein TKK_0017111 [Trichogramma kaykai]